jgi:hypothetical protein
MTTFVHVYENIYNSIEDHQRMEIYADSKEDNNGPVKKPWTRR